MSIPAERGHAPSPHQHPAPSHRRPGRRGRHRYSPMLLLVRSGWAVARPVATSPVPRIPRRPGTFVRSSPYSTRRR